MRSRRTNHSNKKSPNFIALILMVPITFILMIGYMFKSIFKELAQSMPANENAKTKTLRTIETSQRTLMGHFEEKRRKRSDLGYKASLLKEREKQAIEAKTAEDTKKQIVISTEPQKTQEFILSNTSSQKQEKRREKTKVSNALPTVAQWNLGRNGDQRRVEQSERKEKKSKRYGRSS